MSAEGHLLECVQGSPEWLQVRSGCVTASRMVDVLAKLKTKPNEEAAARRQYRIELVAERLSGLTTTKYVTAAMQRGIDMEAQARTEYELKKCVSVDTTGFWLHPTINYAGASPDGLVDDDGLIEIKCPEMATHVEYMLAGIPPEEYQPQMLWQMACTGRKWCDFISFDDRMPKKHQLLVVRFQRDEARIAELGAAVEKFLADVKATIDLLERR